MSDRVDTSVITVLLSPIGLMYSSIRKIKVKCIFHKWSYNKIKIPQS